MSTRRLLAEFLRDDRSRLVRDDEAEPIALLGLDDPTLDRLAACDDILVTLPHASPNVFFPRVNVGWYASALQLADPDRHHVRIVLTHVNLSDLGWRPYGWWYLDEQGRVLSERMFTRNKKRKHTVVSSRPPMDAVPAGMNPTDRAAAAAALAGTDLAHSYMLLGASTERQAGLTSAGTVTYVGLDSLVRFVVRQASTDDELGRWCEALLESTSARELGADGTLHSTSAHRALVFDNDTNVALTALLDGPEVLGGAKMEGYWHGVTDRLELLAHRAPTDLAPPRIRRVPDLQPPPSLDPSETTLAQLEDQGVPYSQGLALAEHGPFGAGHREFSPVARPD